MQIIDKINRWYMVSDEDNLVFSSVIVVTKLETGIKSANYMEPIAKWV